MARHVVAPRGMGGRRLLRAGGGQPLVCHPTLGLPMIFCFGLSHATAPVELRERVAVGERDVPQSVQQLTALEGVREAVVLSTCNRMEIYAAADSPAAVTE